MKLGKLDNDRNAKLVVSIPEAVSDELNAYAECYAAVHGQDIPQSRLVGEMLRRFMQEDTSFQKWLKSRPVAEAVPAPVPAAVPTPAAKPVTPLVTPSFGSDKGLAPATGSTPSY